MPDGLPCATCGRHGDVAYGPAVQVTTGSVAVVLDRRPVVVCPEDHGQPPDAVVAAAMADVERAIARARSRLMRGDVCGACAAPLTMPARRSTRGVTVVSSVVDVLTLRFDLPLTRCPSCGLDQLPGRSQEDLVVSVPAVFARGQARTPGSGT